MPNTNRSWGLEPIGRSNTGGCFQTMGGAKPAAIGTAIFRFDVVRLEATGTQIVDGRNKIAIQPGGTPGTDLYAGVALNYGAASTLTEHLFVGDPQQIYAVQDDGTGSGLLDVDLNLNCNFVFTAGNATTKQSNHQLAGSTKAVTAGLDARIQKWLDIVDPLSGSAAGQYRRAEIMILKHVYAQGVAGV